MDEPQFQLMKSKAILINTTRYSIVNSEPLYQALKQGNIAGATIIGY